MPSDFYSLRSAEQKKYYNQTAQRYDQWHVAPPSAKIVDAWNFANLKKFLKGERLNRTLDLGCGTGRLSHNLLTLSQEVYGVDASAEVLKIAQTKYPQLKLTCAEVIALPYADNFFDLVVINGSLHHFFALSETLQEAQRVLKSHGLFVLLGEPNANFFKWFNPFFYLWVVDRIIVRISQVFSRRSAREQDLKEPVAEKYQPGLLKKQFRAVGFSLEEFYSYDYLVRHESRWWLKFYPSYLKFEHKFLARVFPGLGSALQIIARKK
jgi:ubiquinone/menaquinone biosynthesis C-methylase UbiE